jgi:hypothetical protein
MRWRFPGDRFLLLLFAAVALLAVVMSAVLSSLMTRIYLAWVGDSTAAIVRQHVPVSDLDDLLGSEGGPANRERWEAALRKLVASVPEVVRARAWDRHGAFHSSEGTGRGDEALEARSLQRARGGRIAAQLMESSGADSSTEFRLMVEVYVPVMARDGSHVLGVLGICKDPIRLRSALHWGLVAIWSVSLTGGLAVCVVAFALFRWTSAGRRPGDPGRAQAPAPEVTSAAILADIDRRFGFVPPFFEPAIGVPPVLENLWRQTLSAYVENPLPALFREQLFAYLARYCAVPYCIVCHSCALRPLGMTAAEVLALLESPPPEADEIGAQLAALMDARAPLAAWPEPGSPLATALRTCAIVMFLSRDEAERCQAEVRRLIGPDAYAHLTGFLAYVRTCLLWVETHPELAYEADRRAQDNLGPLLDAAPRLREFFRTYTERVKRERRRREGADA